MSVDRSPQATPPHVLLPWLLLVFGAVLRVIETQLVTYLPDPRFLFALYDVVASTCFFLGVVSVGVIVGLRALGLRPRDLGR